MRAEVVECGDEVSRQVIGRDIPVLILSHALDERHNVLTHQFRDVFLGAAHAVERLGNGESEMKLVGHADAVKALYQMVVQHSRTHRWVVRDVTEHGDVRIAHGQIRKYSAGVDVLQHAGGDDTRAAVL